MTPALRTARTCTAATFIGAGLAAAGATVTPLLALPGLWVGGLAWWCAWHAYDAHARDQRPQRVGAVPCCSFWKYSDGEVHGPGCVRPVLPRRDTYRLDPDERRVFEEISRHYDDRSAA